MELDPLLNSGRELSVADFTAAWPGVPQATVYSRIRALVVRGVLSQVGRGRYVAVRKPAYAVDVTPWMVEVILSPIEAKSSASLDTGTKSNLRGRVLGEAEKYSFIALQEKRVTVGYCPQNHGSQY